jgi:23S rRNA pseudouridine1911/1915/1917 synthase
MRTIEYIIDDKDDSKQILAFLKRRGYSSSVITTLKKHDSGIVLNGVRVFTTAILHSGDRLMVCIEDEPSDITPVYCGYKIAYEDEDVLVYDKPAGVAVHPTKIYQTNTLGNDYAYRLMQRDLNCTFRPVYRIDRNTSGLVLIAKNKLASSVKVDKIYTCICHGIIPKDGSFDSPIRLCEGSKIKRETAENGQTAITHFKRIAVGNGFSEAEVRLETGRTHQIRVHFSSAGFPLAGDTLYGDYNDSIARHALHCGQIAFNHPVSGRRIELKSELPADMSDFIKENNIF